MTLYRKYYSFVDFYSKSPVDNISIQYKRAIKLIIKKLKNCIDNYYSEILTVILSNLKNKKESIFKINFLVADEMLKISDENIPKYLFHRYRYDIFPKDNRIDDYPPCIQIEPSSICNYRCVFCYQKYLSQYKNINGFMTFDMYKKIIDKIEGKVQFVSLASRGEPFLCKDINNMLEYSKNKFISLKINTNASNLKEDNIYSILEGNVSTLVFSVDSFDKYEYESIRKNGNFYKVFKNINKFYEIKKNYYSYSKIITRISGVKINDQQNIDKMKEFWNDIIDQIAIVVYCPWENIYKLDKNKVTDFCKELWRRMFIWYNGDINPCENDFLSFLKIGNINDGSLKDIWNSYLYKKIRKKHLNRQRYKLYPCNRCSFG